jgi:ArsR family transcriptional regulator, zinc-responsive transcriptional repressor
MRVSAYDDSAVAPGGYEAGASLLRALASPVRLAIIDALGAGERCVHELMDSVLLPQTQVSQHLRLLKDAEIVTGRRRGREVVYSLADRNAVAIARAALAHDRPAT